MGYGDEIMASWYARGAAARGVRVAFGDGRQSRWHRFAYEIHKNNPNVAAPGFEKHYKIEWVKNWAGERPYALHDRVNDKWIYYPGYNNRPGEIYFTRQEFEKAATFGRDFIIMEPNVPKFKSSSVNKDWGKTKYQEVADRLIKAGHQIVQPIYEGTPHWPGFKLRGARHINTPRFRQTLGLIQQAKMYIGPEGGMHHAAAALGKPAVVIFGGFILPDITGYDSHINISRGTKSCGNFREICKHCREAMNSITVDEVHVAAEQLL